MGPKKGPDGKLAITLPMGDAKLPGIAAEDIGRCAYGIFKKGPELIGKTRRHRRRTPHRRRDGRRHSPRSSAKRSATTRSTPSVYRGFGFPGAEDLGNMFQFKRDFEKDFRGARPVDETRALNPKLQSFSEWLNANRERIPKG